MKTTTYIILAIAGLTATIFSSCNMACKEGSGKVVTDTRKVDDFTKIDVGGGYKIILKQDSSQTVAVTIDDNLQNLVKTSVSGGVLSIKTKKSLCSTQQAQLVIGVRNLEGIDASGAIELYSDGRLNVKDLDLDFSGSSKADLDLNAANVRTEGSGATELRLKGQAGSHRVELSGSGNIDAFNFVVGDYSIETSGASDCKINVLNSLNVNTSGGSSIEYKGNPKNVTNHESGSSEIKKVE
ncbi:DUF2807 domain-containing protein [Mucilaginibacter limnophilus]|uniref:DUF2807 domain-containing protein n=1 Tax=Mucilaginibacter limnophilus TaxID=1932778 RepID=A0A3S2WW17_9SPHI|nr:head GIN domain-containing protein [Mucilaginibacter limnophilus]RVT98024.1 DUF2807 domain-containing protein [Mucilaginibacter limnophilus]